MANATIDVTQVTLPDERPAWMTDDRDWRIARATWGPEAERGSLRDLADELGLTRERIRQLKEKIAFKLQYPDFADLDGYLRMALIGQGYSSGDDLRLVSDEELLAISGVGPVAVEVIRSRWPRS